MSDLDEKIAEIKKTAYEYSKNYDMKIPEYCEIDLGLFYNIASIYVLHYYGAVDTEKAKLLMQNRIARYKIEGMWREIYREHDEKERKVEELTIEMGKNPSVKTALEILYELIPSLKLQKSNIDTVLGVKK